MSDQPDDETFLARVRKRHRDGWTAHYDETQRLLDMLDAAHDYQTETLCLLQDKAKDAGAYDQVAKGWREDGAAEERLRCLDRIWSYRGGAQSGDAERTLDILYEDVKGLAGPGTMSASSAARRRGDELEALVRRAYRWRSLMSDTESFAWCHEAERVLGEDFESIHGVSPTEVEG